MNLEKGSVQRSTRFELEAKCSAGKGAKECFAMIADITNVTQRALEALWLVQGEAYQFVFPSMTVRCSPRSDDRSACVHLVTPQYRQNRRPRRWVGAFMFELCVQCASSK